MSVNTRVKSVEFWGVPGENSTLWLNSAFAFQGSPLYNFGVISAREAFAFKIWQVVVNIPGFVRRKAFECFKLDAGSLSWNYPMAASCPHF